MFEIDFGGVVVKVYVKRRIIKRFGVFLVRKEVKKRRSRWLRREIC